MNIKTFITGLLVAVSSLSCAEATTIAPTRAVDPLPPRIFTPFPPTVESVERLETPTPFNLPFNDQNVESEYCQLPSVKISVSEAEGLGDDEIAARLMGLHLAYFNASEAPDWCKINGYRIEKIFYDERTPYLPLVPKSDIMRVIEYSMKLIQIPNFWMSLAGEVDQENWLHTRADVAIFRLPDGYTMKFAHP